MQQVKFGLILFLAAFVSCTVYAQKSTISLEESDSLAALYFQQGQLEKAIVYTEQSLKHLEPKGFDTVYAEHLSNLASIYMTMGAYQDAEPLYLDLLKIQKKLFGETSEPCIITLSYLGMLYDELEQYAQAEAMYTSVLELIGSAFGEESLAYAQALNNLASLQEVTKAYEKAVPLYLRSIELKGKLKGKSDPSYAVSLNNLAGVYKKMERYEDAEPLYLSANKIWKNALGVKHRYYIMSVNNLGALYSQMGDNSQAIQLYKQSSDLCLEVLGAKHPAYLQSLNNLANTYTKIQQFDQAKQLYELAITSNCINNDPRILSDFSFLAKQEFHSTVKITETLLAYQEFLAKQHELSPNPTLLQSSYEVLSAAVSINEKVHNSFARDKDKLAKLSKMSFLSGKSIDLCLQLAEPSYLEEAFVYAEHNKSVLLTDALKADRAHAMSNLPDSLAEKEGALQEKLAKQQKALILAKDESERSKQRKQLNELYLEIKEFKQAIEKDYPKYHQLKYASISTKVKDVQQALDKQTALIEYFIADSASFVFYIDQSKLVAQRLPMGAVQFKEPIAAFRNALTNYTEIQQNPKEAYSEYTKWGKQFYDWLLADILQNAGNEIKHLVLVADGELGYLPFETLLTKKANANGTYEDLDYLMKQYKISYNYSAALFKENREKIPSNSNNEILAIAAAYNSGGEISAQTRSTRSPYLLNLRKVLSPLPAAQKEVDDLQESFKGLFLSGDAASEDAFKKEASNYGIIHLAMHGLLNQQQPILSSLAFSENQDSSQDNFLQAYEIAQLDLNASLVVLSACETGYGKFEQGEGVMSLARSFMYAGVPAMVVSMWEVNDISTSVIMTSFYNNLSK